MASIKMTYIVQSCPICHKQLLKVAAGSTLIGSPLLTCKKCGMTYKTNLRTEWYAYPNKYLLFVLPLIIGAIALVVGAVMGADLLIGMLAAIFGMFIGLCFTIKDVILMIISKKRMRNAQYLDKLLQYNAITQREHEEFMRKAA